MKIFPEKGVTLYKGTFSFAKLSLEIYSFQSLLTELLDHKRQQMNMEQSSFIVSAASSGVLIIVNLFGNTLVCFVILRNRDMRTPLNYLLFNLAVTDTLTGIFFIPMIVFGFIPNEAEGTAAKLLCKFIVHGTLMFPCAKVSAFSLAAIAFERYQAVVHPFRVRKNITKKKTIVFIIMSWILAICTMIPWFIGFDLDGSVPRKCKVKAEYKEALEFYSYISGVSVSGVPLLATIILYGRIITNLLKKQNQIIEQNQQVTFRIKKRITAMLITVTLTFTTIWVVTSAFTIAYGYTPGNLAALIIAILLLISSSINWVLYALFSKQFRSCFKRALCSCSKTEQPSNDYPRVKENSTCNEVFDTRL